MQLNQNRIFFRRPRLFVVVRVKMIPPALAALLADSPWKHVRKFGPVLCPELPNKVNDCLILLARPRPFDKSGINNFTPTLRNLLSRLPGEVQREFRPMCTISRMEELLEELIFCWGPARVG
jgi:hypothetical protein